MTEIYENHPTSEFTPRPIQWDAFVIASIAGPIIVTGLTFWIYYIPLAALVLGGIPYLILGTPALIYHLRRNAPDVGEIIGLSIVVLLGACTVLGLIGALIMGEDAFGIIVLYAVFGLIFAPLWSWAFTALYIRMTRENTKL